MKRTITRAALLALAVSPSLALAQTGAAFSNLEQIISTFGRIVGQLLPIVFALAILAFFYGIFQYIFSGSGEGKTSGRHVMIWSLVAIFVMSSLYGIIRLAQQTLGIQNANGDFQVPCVDGLSGC